MTNDELRQAIYDASELVRTTAPDSPVHGDVAGHLRALLLEQQRRSAAAPVVPLRVLEPPYTITCGTGGGDIPDAAWSAARTGFCSQ